MIKCSHDTPLHQPAGSPNYKKKICTIKPLIEAAAYIRGDDKKLALALKTEVLP